MPPNALHAPTRPRRQARSSELSRDGRTRDMRPLHEPPAPSRSQRGRQELRAALSIDRRTEGRRWLGAAP
jgi:hypothetical protein